MTTTAQFHMWEVDHPYYCEPGNWFRTGQHHTWSSWAEFRDDTIFVIGDRDLNLLIRWDWHKAEEVGETDNLRLHFVLQRKAWLMSHDVEVTAEDEPEVRAFLEGWAQALRATWEPLLDGAR